jgi:phosphoribosylamine--glycine ligase
MKKIATDNGVPTAIYQTFTNKKNAIEFIKKIHFPIVIKTDGLAAGKGVIISQNFDDAKKNISEIFNGKFGKAGQEIIIEEFLSGFEASYFIICDGENFIPLGFAHDYKKVGENDVGLNTGGMGTCAPSPFIDHKMERQVIEKIIKPSLNGLKKINASFKGILFAGLMINKNEPKLLEFNIRFGDPETQVILPRIKSDFISLIESAIDQKLDQFKIEFDQEKKLVCVVICAKGYPEDYQKGSEIKNLDKITKNNSKVEILHAGTIKKDQKILANGGRVLNVVACDNSFKLAREKAYQIINQIDWEDGFCRKDIALRFIES